MLPVCICSRLEDGDQIILYKNTSNSFALCPPNHIPASHDRQARTHQPNDRAEEQKLTKHSTDLHTLERSVAHQSHSPRGVAIGLAFGLPTGEPLPFAPAAAALALSAAAFSAARAFSFPSRFLSSPLMYCRR